jgi:hypothetical protein
MEQKMSKRNGYRTTGEEQKERGVMERLGSGLAVIFSGIFILPILTVLTGAFGMIGIGLPVVAVMNLFGILHIPFNVLFITLDRNAASVHWSYCRDDFHCFIFLMWRLVEKIHGYCQTNVLNELAVGLVETCIRRE